MRIRLILGLVLVVLFLAGCQTQVTVQDSNESSVEAPAAGNNEVTVDEEVIVPAHEPEPQPEPEPEPEPVVEQPISILEDHVDSEHFLHGNPDAGEIITKFPRKVEIIFNYPVTTGTEVKVTDQSGEVSYVEGDTILADTDLLVTINYLKDIGPGVYKVAYHAVLAGKEKKTEDGYYYFEIQ